MQLSEAEMEVPRSPIDLRAWCASKIEEIGSTTEGKNAIRMGRGLCKPLVEEVYPLAVWASSEERVSEQALISPCIGSQSFDARVNDPNHEPQEYFVEVTQAHMGQVEHFRMLHLEQHGWAPGPLSELVREGGRGGRILPGRVVGNLRGHIERTRELIRSAINGKLEKDYQEPIALIVAFEDFILKNDPDVSEILKEDLKNIVGERSSPFFCFFLVGMSGHLRVKWDR
jgi:hypothetical protein